MRRASIPKFSPLDLDGAVGGGQLSVSAGLNEIASSLNAKVNVSAEKIAADSLNKFLLLPENYFSGEIERLALVGTGAIDSPRTCGAARCHCRSAMRMCRR